MRQTLTLLLLLWAGALWAAPVEKSAAKAKALQFMTQRNPLSAAKGIRASATRKAPGEGGDAQPALFVFNFGEGDGYVVVSGDDRTEPILGYADRGTLDEQTMPENLRGWLNEYAEAIARLDETAGSTAGAASSAPRIQKAMKTAARHAIAPLLSSQWDQSAPYDLQCPVITVDDKEQHCATGCVATAMAQLMYYHRWPAANTAAIPAYTTNTLKLSIEGIAAGTAIDWASMRDTYTSSDTDAGATAVATLMRLCGTSVEMDYNESSGAVTAKVPERLVSYFDYDEETTCHVSRDGFAYDEWQQLIYRELLARRPVLYHGTASDGGHAFLIDGYQDDDFFHFNWGWGGMSDGYYRLRLCNPTEQGIGGSSTNDGYGANQGAGIGIRPHEAGSAYTDMTSLTTTLLTAQTLSYERSDDGRFNDITLQANLRNQTTDCTEFDMGVRIADEDGETIGTYTTHSARALALNGKLTSDAQTFSLEAADYPDGIYTLWLTSRRTGSDTWVKNKGWEQEYCRMKMTVSGQTLTLIPANTTQSLSVTGWNFAGEMNTLNPVEVTATVANSGGNYRGNMFYQLNDDDLELAGYLEVSAGSTGRVVFGITGLVGGDNTLKLYCKDEKTIIGQTTISVTDPPASGDVDLTATATVEHLSANQQNILGNRIQAVVTVSNTTEENFQGAMQVSLYENGQHISHRYMEKQAMMAGGSKQISFSYEGLTAGNTYKLALLYKKGEKVQTIQLQSYGCENAITWWDAKGRRTVVEDNQMSYSVPAEATAVELEGLTTLSTVEPNSNPNCLYFTDEEDDYGLSGANVIRNGSGAVSLQDGHDYYSPRSYTATSIEYQRQSDRAADGTGGWETIVLPFSVTRVEADGKAIDWFHSAGDEDKDFWLKEFTAEYQGTVYFDHAAELKANTPYIIALPGNHWGEEFSLLGKTIRFCGADNTAMTATTSANITATTHKLNSTTVALTGVENAYKLNDEGTSFVQQATATIPAFRAYFTDVQNSLDMARQLRIASGRPTGVESLTLTPIQEGEGPWYNLAGQRVAQPTMGIFVKNGKKVIK